MTTKQYIFLHRVIGRAGVIWTKWAVTEQADDGSPLDFGLAVIEHYNGPNKLTAVRGLLRPGAKFTLEVVESGVIFSASGYTGIWKNEADRKKWISEDKTIEVEQAVKKENSIANDIWKTGLDPYREAYHGATSWQKKQAILAEILFYITH